MKATSIKQLKFNRGQVSDKLSERSDMGLQGVAGTVYDNVAINKYGSLEPAPTMILNSYHTSGIINIVGMFDTGTDWVIPIGASGNFIRIYKPIKKSDPYYMIDFNAPWYSETMTNSNSYDDRICKTKFYQFGYNCIIYGQRYAPVLISITSPVGDASGWETPIVTIKQNYWDDAFSTTWIRGLDTGNPSDFTTTDAYYRLIPASNYSWTNRGQVTISRESHGDNFVNTLVGQVINCPIQSMMFRVDEIVDANTLKATPLTAMNPPTPYYDANTGTTDIIQSYIKGFWEFGYVNPFGQPLSQYYSAKYYPDSVAYIAQRLVFGGNDAHGNILMVSQVGVLNNFTSNELETSGFVATVSTHDVCRIVALTRFGTELYIGTTNGIYSISETELTPSAIITGGFSRRSRIGVNTNTQLVDISGLLAFVSNDKTSIQYVRYNVISDANTPMSLTSQTSDIFTNIKQFVFCEDRRNDESDAIVALNENGELAIAYTSTNSGLVGWTKLNTVWQGGNNNLYIDKLFNIGSLVWAQVRESDLGECYLVRVCRDEYLQFPVWNNYYSFADGFIIPAAFRYFIDSFVGVYMDDEKGPTFIKPTGTEQITSTDPDISSSDFRRLVFDNEIDTSKIAVCGFLNIMEWRSVAFSVGVATVELNKRIVKCSGVIEPLAITNYGTYAGIKLDEKYIPNFITLVNTKNRINEITYENCTYVENGSIIWRRAFDNPDRELYFGFTASMPFLIKSITASVAYDEVA